MLLQLPHTAIDQDSHVATLQETFEAVLIKHGFLKDGLDAYADEIARSSQEAALAAAARMREGTAAYLASKPPTQYPIQVNPSIYETIDGIAEHTSSVAASTSEVADTVGSHASDAGAWLAMQSRNAALRGAQLPTLESSSSFAPTDLPLSENDESVNGAQTLSTFASMFVATTWAVSSSASAVVTAAGQSFSALVGHEFGPEVQRVANGAGASIVGASRAVGNVSQVVNPTWYGKRGVLGALDVKDPQRADEVRRDERDMRAKAHAAEETARI